MKEDKMRNSLPGTEPLDPDEELSDEEYYEKYLADGEISYQDEALNAVLKKEMREAADRLEEELDADPSMEGVEPSPEAFEKVMALAREAEKRKAAGEAKRSPGEQRPLRPEDYLSEEDRRALEIGRRSLERKGRRRLLRWLGPVAAVLVCVLVVSVSSEANRIRIINAYHVLVGDEAMLRLNNDEDSQTIHLKERKDREEIREKTGMDPVQFLYNPKGLTYDSYEIMNGNRRAALFYHYQDTILTVLMMKQEKGVARGDVQDGEILDVFEADTKIGKIQIQELDGDLEKKYMTEFVRENTLYRIYGALPREEFVSMMESLFF